METARDSRPRSTWILLAVVGLVGLLIVGALARQVLHARADRAHVATAVSATSVVHELQVERGLSSLYLAGDDSDVRQRLLMQRRRVDVAIAHERRDGSDFGARATARIDKVVALRGEVDSGSVKSTDIVREYSRTIALLLATTSGIGHVADRHVMHELTTLTHLSAAKEASGQQRALLAAALRDGAFTAAGYHAFVKADSTRSSELSLFRETAAAGERREFDVTVSGSGVRESAASIEAALAAGASVKLTQSADAWFAAQTQRIERMRVVERSVAANAAAEADHGVRHAWLMVGIAGCITLIAMLIGFRLPEVVPVVRRVGEGARGQVAAFVASLRRRAFVAL